jgi:LacI family transcriptional regulator
MPRPATIRSLASTLKLSVATVSEALRDSSRVKAATKQRVLRAAEAAGYQRNPLLGATFSALRRARHQGFSGMLALVDVANAGVAELGLFHREVVKGASSRAQELGFRTELFWVGDASRAVSVGRLSRVLRARGITGVIFLPFDRVYDFSAFDFTQMAAVSMENRLLSPTLHTVQPDHYLSIRRALQVLTERGYKRIGLCLESGKDERVDFKWSSGFISFFRLSGRKMAVQPLIADKLSQESFHRWFRANGPDVIVGHGQFIIDWLKAENVRVPEDVGFFRINLTERTVPCAGLDLRPEKLGANAVETVVAMLHRREVGVPAVPISISIDAIWADGPTLK